MGVAGGFGVAAPPGGGGGMFFSPCRIAIRSNSPIELLISDGIGRGATGETFCAGCGIDGDASLNFTTGFSGVDFDQPTSGNGGFGAGIGAGGGTALNFGIPAMVCEMICGAGLIS